MESSLKKCFTRLMSLASRRRRRITSYLHDAHCRAKSLHRCWFKLTAYKLRDYDIIAKIKQKSDNFRLKNALGRVYLAIFGMRRRRLEAMASLSKADKGYLCAREGCALRLMGSICSA